jgi:hypothetical protein
MAGQKEKITTIQIPEAELRIEEITGSSGSIVRLQSVSTVTAPRVGEKIQLNEDKFKVVEVSHRFSGSPLKHVVIVTVEKPQGTAIQ